MGNQQERSFGWLAGIVDGEGSITFSVTTRPNGNVVIVPFVCVVNTDKGILDAVEQDLRALSGKAPQRLKHGRKQYAESFTGKLPCEIIRLDGQCIRPVLEAILPHLQSRKRESARVVLEYLTDRAAGLIARDEKGRIRRKGYTSHQIDLVCAIRNSPRAKSSEAIRRAPNVSGDDMVRPYGKP